MRLITIFTLALCAMADEFPSAEIRNAEVTARIYLPDPEKGYYRGTRFDWSGQIASLRAAGHEYFGQWFPKYDPKLHDAIMGPVEEFRSPDGGLGYAEAKPGDTFVRIGVGVVRKPEDKAYESFRTYDIVDPGAWKVKVDRDRAHFEHTLKGPNGYAYAYRKVLRLDGRALVIEHELRNTGTRRIDTQQYNHNFFVMDGQPTGPALRVRFPFDLKAVTPFTDDAARVSGGEITYARELTPEDRVYGVFEGSPAYEFEAVNGDAAVRVTGDRPIVKLVYWSIRTVFSPECYVDVSVDPGKSLKWAYRYEFSDRKAAR